MTGCNSFWLTVPSVFAWSCSPLASFLSRVWPSGSPWEFPSPSSVPFSSSFLLAVVSTWFPCLPLSLPWGLWWTMPWWWARIFFISGRQGSNRSGPQWRGRGRCRPRYLIAVATNIIAFLPLLFVSGSTGRFFSILPAVVISVFLISLVECSLRASRPPQLSEKGAERKSS